MDDVVLIVKGGAIAENMDVMGNFTILGEFNRGEVYGLESAYAGDNFYKDTLIASKKSLVLFMNKHRIITPCSNRCRRHDIVVKHIMQIVAESNIKLLEKLTHMSKKSTRDKLLSYLTTMSDKAGSEYFEIPFNKTELASYLSVDRSAMSTELGKMRDEGLVDYDKKRYRLIKSKLKK